ncbi:hypothetical protein [Achromobacter marplatensis]|uniref:hypothetical protein n=1 Tax=Achromobacter marplatensis TaxID=470868 RepID=UPI003C773625
MSDNYIRWYLHAEGFVMSNSALQDLIRAEEAQICFLKRQLSIHDERLGLLQRLLSEDLRPARLVETDEPFGNKLGSPTSWEEGHHAVPVVSPPLALHKRPRLAASEAPKIPDESVKLLRFIGNKGKSLDEIVEFCEREGIQKTRHAVTSFCSNYTVTYELLERIGRGQFRLSEKGANYLNEAPRIAHEELRGEPAAVERVEDDVHPYPQDDDEEL